jgi:hypothetical protein
MKGDPSLARDSNEKQLGLAEGKEGSTNSLKNLCKTNKKTVKK